MKKVTKLDELKNRIECHKPLKIKFSATEDEFPELVDSFFDLFVVVDVVEDELSDGWQVSDVFGIADAVPSIKEIFNDVPIFLKEFVRLRPSKAKDIIQAARELFIESRGDTGVLLGKVITGLELLATAYAFFDFTRKMK